VSNPPAAPPQDSQFETPFTEQVLAVVRAGPAPRDCRDIAELRTGSLRMTPLEAYRLVVETPGSLHIRVGNRRVNLLPARCGAVLYVRTLASDSPSDPLLDLPEAAD
jgi:hypothetical protein